MILSTVCELRRSEWRLHRESQNKRSVEVAGGSEGEQLFSSTSDQLMNKNIWSKQLSDRRGQFLCLDLSVPVCLLVNGDPGTRSGRGEATVSVPELMGTEEYCMGQPTGVVGWEHMTSPGAPGPETSCRG